MRMEGKYFLLYFRWKVVVVGFSSLISEIMISMKQQITFRLKFWTCQNNWSTQQGSGGKHTEWIDGERKGRGEEKSSTMISCHFFPEVCNRLQIERRMFEPCEKSCSRALKACDDIEREKEGKKRKRRQLLALRIQVFDMRAITHWPPFLLHPFYLLPFPHISPTGFGLVWETVTFTFLSPLK